MKIKLIKTFLSASLFFIIAFPAMAGIDNAFKDKLSDVAVKGAGYSNDTVTFEAQISNYIILALSFLGVIFLVLTIYAGYLWMTAQGNEPQVKKAKDIMTRAIVGVIIVVSAYGISSLVISTLGKGQLTNLEEQATTNQ